MLTRGVPSYNAMVRMMSCNRTSDVNYFMQMIRSIRAITNYKLTKIEKKLLAAVNRIGASPVRLQGRSNAV